MEVLDLLHPLETDHRAHDPLVLLGILELDPEGLLHLVDRQRVLDRAAFIGLLEVGVRLLLGLEVDPAGCDFRIALQRAADLVLLGLRRVDARVALIAASVLRAEEDRNLDLLVPAALHQVHLLAGQQPGAEQGQRHPHRHDDGQRHGQVLPQPCSGLGQDVAETHQQLPRGSVSYRRFGDIGGFRLRAAAHW
jgi:hypothetical protein